MNWPISTLLLRARDFSLEAVDVIWILGATTRFTKFASLEDFRTGKDGGEVVATKFMKASSKSLRCCSRIRSGGGSIPTASLSNTEAELVACYRSDQHHAEEALHAQSEMTQRSNLRLSMWMG